VEEKRKSNRSLSIDVDIDCSEALKGLKAITREAKKATSALKELEQQQKESDALLFNPTIIVNCSMSGNTSDVKKAVQEALDEQYQHLNSIYGTETGR